ncbi:MULTISPECIES: hypothetical protein [Tsukamurella]|uniref:Uncharacterized protein n=1 Tax=Tsukamurella strandjordii TaxID=147577 RepID=A0AA90NEF7_9ACTN|nr:MULTISPECIES: hypothetical protein [Tsukamurella]MDP0396854.1 hypothetical protein [Tsukamurella strandjordii]GIZ96656.1 hypothetical protein TTY48_12680 [Tsukamurella sp. TY48]
MAQHRDDALTSPLRTLGELAEKAGLAATDIAVLSGVSRSSVSRLWSDPRWLDKASGSIAQALSAVVPGIRDYATLVADTVATRRAGEACEAAGLELDWSLLADLVDEDGAVGVVPALFGAAALAGNAETAAHALSRCWGAAADRACDAIFRPPSSGGVVADPGAVVDGARRIVAGAPADGAREVIGRGMALHRLTRNCGHDRREPEQSSSGFPLSEAFRYRGAATGRMIAGDSDVLRRYRAVLVREAALQWAEVWSLATYSRDLAPRISGPMKLKPGRLRGTAEQVLADLDATTPAYQEYLLTCAIPLLVQADPRFGNQDQQLVAVLSDRVDSVPAARTAMAALRRYAHRPPARER